MSDFQRRSKASVIVWCLMALTAGFIVSTMVGCCSTKYRAEFIGERYTVGIDIAGNQRLTAKYK